MLKKLKKIRGRSLKEIRTRSAQTFSAHVERYGWSKQARPLSDTAFFKLLETRRNAGNAIESAESLHGHFQTRLHPRFFAAFDNKDLTRDLLQRRFGRETEAFLLDRAQRVMNGRFCLLGLRDLSFGDPVDWHLEPLTGKRPSSEMHWSQINFLDAEIAGDKKITWELNRHQYFATLGRAYWRTGDERYAQTFAAHVQSWIEANPPTRGINWASSLEVAFRAISWLWALYFFKDSPQLTPQLILCICKSLYKHARHLEKYLSTYFSPNTHLTGEALGLFYLGTLLPEFREAARWRATGRRILLAELARHVRPDGVYFEQSSYYHRYTADFYTHFLLLARANGDEEVLPNSPLLEDKLSALLDHLMYITRPDGTTPFFGDDDGGRLAVLDERAPNDFRAALASGAAIFAREDYKYVAREVSEETLWLLGGDGLRAFDQLAAQPPAQTSRAFKDGGYYVMRDGWTSEANYLLIDCGPHGIYNCGHAHADALAYEVAARGRTLLIDPGTYTYTGAMHLRDEFRSSMAHNVLIVDNESSSVTDSTFTWKHIAQCRAHSWISNTRFDYFVGEHNGYMRLAAPVRCARSVLFLKQDYWIMRDRVESSGEHLYEWRFHFTDDAAPSVSDDQAAESSAKVLREQQQRDKAGLEIYSFGENGVWRRENGWVSPCYAARLPAPVYSFSLHASGAKDFLTFLVPRRAGQRRTTIKEMEATRDYAFEIVDGQTADVLLVNSGEGIETARFASDFEWSLMRYDRNTDQLQELVLINGQRLQIDRREMIRAAGRIDYVTARRVNDKLYIEAAARDEWKLDLCGVFEEINQVILEGGEIYPLTKAGTLNFFGNVLKQNSVRPRAAEEALPVN
jgi:hypothetical protein